MVDQVHQRQISKPRVPDADIETAWKGKSQERRLAGVGTYAMICPLLRIDS